MFGAVVKNKMIPQNMSQRPYTTPVVEVICLGLEPSILQSSVTPVSGEGEAKSIAIFGSRGAGKTTLWKQLRGEFKDMKYIPTPGADPISEFTVEHNGVKMTIKKTADFSGADEMVKRYDELIEEGTFIYYLIELTDLLENKSETRARLQKISSIIKKKDLKENASCRLVGTHYRKYESLTGKSRDEARLELSEVIGLDSIMDARIEDTILILELTERTDVCKILDQIIKLPL